MRHPVKRFALPLLGLFFAASLVGGQAAAPNRNVRFGMPSMATADPSNREDYLIARPQDVLSYNDKKKTANWVVLGTEGERHRQRPADAV
jgi:hypothetical protein